MTRSVLNRRSVSTLTRRARTTAAYSRRQPQAGWAAGADTKQLQLTAMAAAAT